jgi:hypothetical protein
VEHQELLFIAGGMQIKWDSHFWRQFGSFYCPTPLTIQFSNHTPQDLQGDENLCPQKNLHVDIYSSFIHNCPKLEATKISFNSWLNKLWYIQTVEYDLVLSRNEDRWKKCQCVLLTERSQSEKASNAWV